MITAFFVVMLTFCTGYAVCWMRHDLLRDELQIERALRKAREAVEQLEKEARR